MFVRLCTLSLKFVLFLTNDLESVLFVVGRFVCLKTLSALILEEHCGNTENENLSLTWNYALFLNTNDPIMTITTNAPLAPMK